MAAENITNNAQTTLNGSINNAVTSIVVNSATPFPQSGQYRIIIDSEIMIVTGGQGTTTWTVTRGAESTVAASHNSGAVVSHIITAGGISNLAPSAYWSSFAPAGLTGATQASRYVGATTSAAPVSGTFAVGDYIIDRTGVMWICVTAGSPGTWTSAVSSGSILAATNYTGTNAYNFGTTMAALDTTNLTVGPFTVPTNGKIIVTLEADIGLSGGGTNPSIYYAVKNHTGGAQLGPQVRVWLSGSSSVLQQRMGVSIYLTGLSAGTSLQLDWAGYHDGTVTSASLQVDNGLSSNIQGPALMTVRSTV